MWQELALQSIPGVVLAVVGYLLGLRKNNADVRTSIIDAEEKAGAFYRNLLDDAARRLNDAIDVIQKKDQQITQLMATVEDLTEQLKKYKQLNGKTP